MEIYEYLVSFDSDIDEKVIEKVLQFLRKKGLVNIDCWIIHKILIPIG